MIGSVSALTVLVTPLMLPLAQQVGVHRSYAWIAPPRFGVLLVAAYSICARSLPLMFAALVSVFGSIALRSKLTGRTVLEEHSRSVLFTLTLVTSAVGIFWLSSKITTSFFHPRYFFFLQVPVLALICLGIDLYPRSVQRFLIITISAVALMPSTRYLIDLRPAHLERDIMATVASEQMPIIFSNKCGYARVSPLLPSPSQQMILEDAERSNVFLYPGAAPEFVSDEKLGSLEQYWLVEIPCEEDSERVMASPRLGHLISNPSKIDQLLGGSLLKISR